MSISLDCSANPPKATMTSTFHNFAKLPTELRLAIWEYSLDEDKDGRHVLLRLEFSREHRAKGHQQTVMPTRQLASPLLKVNHEAREVFLKFFPVAVDILKTEVGAHNVWTKFVMVHRMQAGELRLSRQFLYDAASLQEKERHAGRVYLRPETDIFVLGFGAVTGSARNLVGYRKIFQCQSRTLPKLVTGNIKQVLCLSPFEPCQPRESESSWDFTSVDTYTAAETYQCIGPKRVAGAILDFDERLEWERLRWSAAKGTPRKFRKELAQTRLPLQVRWLVHNGRRCRDRTIRIG